MQKYRPSEFYKYICQEGESLWIKKKISKWRHSFNGKEVYIEMKSR